MPTTKIMHVPRQTAIYTCGAACLAAVSRLQGGALEERVLAKVLNARPVVGIDNDQLWQAARCIGAIDCGENVWDGKRLSILNILNPISGVGHYVVGLRQADDTGNIAAYCPYYANTLLLDAEWLNKHWVSGDGRYSRWAIVFDTTLDNDVICIGESWPELGLAAGEANPCWLLRSVRKFLSSVIIA